MITRRSVSFCACFFSSRDTLNSHVLQKITRKDHLSSDFTGRRDGRTRIPARKCVAAVNSLFHFRRLDFAREMFDIPLRLVSSLPNELNHSLASILSGISGWNRFDLPTVSRASVLPGARSPSRGTANSRGAIITKIDNISFGNAGETRAFY